eukprot:GILK01010469.1.p1 GENE.GILK01010469.1~~GILK01010469.1.p1  ORF type:complete len:796 (-),score=129.17 GILK01010469.1:124-2511(-)
MSDPSPDVPSPDKDGAGISTTVVFGVLTLAGCLLAFSLLRNRIKGVYAARYRRLSIPCEGLPSGMFGWVKQVLAYKDEELFKSHGLDALMYSLHLRANFMITFLFVLFAFPCLLPAFWNGMNKDRPSEDAVKGILLFSQTNVEQGSSLLFWPVAGIYVFTAVTFLVTKRLFDKFLEYRNKVTHMKLTRNFAVMIEETNTKSAKQLEQRFERLFPGRVVTATVAYHLEDLHHLMEHYKEAERQLEYAHMNQLKLEQASSESTPLRVMGDSGPVLQHWEGKFAFLGPIAGQLGWARKVNSIEHWSEKVSFLRDCMEDSQRRLQTLIESGDELDLATRVSFVTFKDTRTARIASQTIIGQHAGELETKPAPDPADVLWKSLNIGTNQRTIRGLFVNIAFFFIVAFGGASVTFLQGLANLETLSRIKGLGFLDWINHQSSFIRGIVTDLLPALVLVTFMALLSPTIGYISSFHGYHTKSRLAKTVFQIYYLFLAFNVFFVSTISGSVLVVLDDIIHNFTFTDIVRLLSTSLPQQSLFFMNYIIVKTFSEQGWSLLQIGFMFVRWFKLTFMTVTAKERAEAGDPGPFEYPVYYSNVLLMWTLTAVYANMAPLLLGFSVLYFGVCYVVHRYLILYVFVPDMDGGGRLWHSVFRRTMVGLIIAQITLAGLFGIKEFPFGSTLTAPLIAVTAGYTFYMSRKYRRPTIYGYLSADEEICVEAVGEEEELDLQRSYVQPELQPINSWSFDQLQSDAHLNIKVDTEQDQDEIDSRMNKYSRSVDSLSPGSALSVPLMPPRSTSNRP